VQKENRAIGEVFSVVIAAGHVLFFGMVSVFSGDFCSAFPGTGRGI
jgi:hypothetical protein